MDDKDRGLYAKYQVERADGKPIKGQAIVLESGDPCSWPAIVSFSNIVRARGYVSLAEDLLKLVQEEMAENEKEEKESIN